MAKKIKCQYCGRQYSIQNERDCCPGCGAYNESHLQGQQKFTNSNFNNEEFKDDLNSQKFQTPPINNQQTTHHTLGIVKIILIALAIPFVLFWVLVIMSVFIENMNSGNDYDNDYSYEYNYDSSYKEEYTSNEDNYSSNTTTSNQNGVRQEIDWDAGSQYKYGTWDEVYKFFNDLDSRRKSEIKTTIRIDDKLEYKDTILYLDNIGFSYSHSSSGSSYVYVDINVENSKALSNLPDVIDFYLVQGDRRDRLTEHEDWFLSYGHDDITKMEQVFGIEYTGKTDWTTKVSNLVQYESLEIEIDGKSYSFDLIYDDDETRATYYNYK